MGRKPAGCRPLGGGMIPMSGRRAQSLEWVLDDAEVLYSTVRRAASDNVFKVWHDTHLHEQLKAIHFAYLSCPIALALVRSPLLIPGTSIWCYECTSCASTSGSACRRCLQSCQPTGHRSFTFSRGRYLHIGIHSAIRTSETMPKTLNTSPPPASAAHVLMKVENA